MDRKPIKPSKRLVGPFRPAKPAPPKPKPPLHGRTKELNHGSLEGYVLHYPRVLRASVRPELYAIIGTWYEADVIEATVKNCFANGASKVYIVDNASPDATCEVARAAGAVIAKVYKTDYYDDDLRLRLMNEVMREVSAHEKLPWLWWMALDADEFPCGPHGESVLDFLHKLHPGVDCIGANAIDLYPTSEPYYAPGKHPADCQTHGLRRAGGRNVFCSQGHWKHPLLRCLNGEYNLAQTRGIHTPFVKGHNGVALFVPTEISTGLVMFHAPIRGREATTERLRALCTKQEALGGQHRSIGDDNLIQANGAIKRWRSLEHIYAGEWDQVELPHAQIYGGNVKGIAPLPWRNLVPEILTFPRWYRTNEPPVPVKTELPVL